MKKYVAFLVAMAIVVACCGAVGADKTSADASDSVVTAASTDLIAFPGAEGGGMYTTGARGSSSSTIYHVTSLANSGTGTLRDAVSKGNRVIVFDVAGTINLTDYLRISKDNITILGQTSPGDGICISGAPTMVNADNIIIRYLRFRMGVYDYENKKYDDDAFGGGRNCTNLIVDHCSMSFANDECCSIYATKNATIQWCIITEPLNKSIHDEGSGIEEHGYGGIWGGINTSYHHNLVSSAKSRFPRVGTSETVSSYNGTADTESLLDIRNNVFYNWRDNSSYGGENGIRVNLVNNYYKEGPASSSIKRFYQMMGGDDGGISNWGTDLAISGNYYSPKSSSTTVDKINADNTLGVDTADTVNASKQDNTPSVYDETEEPSSTNHTQYIIDYPIYTDTAEEAYEKVLAGAGASIVRDEVDERAVRSAMNRTSEVGTNGIVNYSDWVEMTPQTYSGTKETDTDGDGIPDEWEDANGLDKNDASDAIAIVSSGEYAGYYNIEVYSFDLADDEPAPVPTIDPNAPTATPKPTATPTATPTLEPTATPEPKYDITADENMTNGTIEINGSSTRSAVWSAYDRQSDIDGAKTINWNGSDETDGTITMYDTTTTVSAFGDETIARGTQNPSISVPITSTPTGSVYMFKPANDGQIDLELYIYVGKSLNIYNNTTHEYLYKEDTSTFEGFHDYSFECTAGNEYYAWASGSKIGLRTATVTGGGIVSEAGKTVTITTVPDSGYRTDSVYTDVGAAVTKVGDNEYTFTMPSGAVVVGAVFTAETEPTPTVDPNPTATPTAIPTSTPTATPTVEPSTATPAPATATPSAEPEKIRFSTVPTIEDGAVSALVVNDEADTRAIVAIAVYDSNTQILKSVSLVYVEPNSEADINEAVSLSDGETVKVFLWDEVLKPYDEVYELK